MMRLSIHTIKSSLGNHILFYVKSNLPEDYPEILWTCVVAEADGGELCDPSFPWRTAEVSMVYFGLKEEPDEWEFELPDGRKARAWNINPGYTNRMAKALKDYSAAMHVARVALFQAKSPEEAAKKLWEYCEENRVMSSLTGDPSKLHKVVREMEEYKEILADDVMDLWGRVGDPPETLS